MQSLSDLFARDYGGAPFDLFGGAHIVAVVIVALAWGGALFWGRTAADAGRRRFRLFLAVVLIGNETVWHIWNASTGQWTIQTMLPLHLCSALVWLSAIMLISRSRPIYPFVYFLGVAGALQAILTPDAGPYGFPHLRFFQIFISHGAIVLAGLWMTVAERFRPAPGDPVRVLLGLNLYAVVVGAVNWITGGNYLYIARKPATASLLDVLPAWPWYLAALELIAMLCVFLLALPFVRGWSATAEPAPRVLQK